MGYRSEVVFANEKDIVPLFIAHIADKPAAQKFCFKENDYHTKDYNSQGHWLFMWNNVKWYDGYPEVMAIRSFIDEKLQNLPESWANDPEEYYRLVIIGEEIDDNQVEGWAFDHIHIQRNISIWVKNTFEQVASFSERAMYTDQREVHHAQESQQAKEA